MNKMKQIPDHMSLSVVEPADREYAWINEKTKIEKPDGWPAVMSWPPKKLRDRIRDGKVNEDNVHKVKAYYDEYARLVGDQSEKILQHMRNNPSLNEDQRRIPFFRAKRRLGYDNTRNQRHIAWAMLLDPNGDYMSVYNQSVMSYGRTSMTLMDGGKVDANEKNVVVHKVSPMAAQLVVEEAMARGWGSIKVSGTSDFVNGVLKHAQARGLAVDATVMMDRFGLFPRKIKTMETLGVNKEAKMRLSELADQMGREDAPPKPKEEVHNSGDEPRMG